MLRHEMQMIGDKVKDFLVPEPACRLAVDLQGTRLESEQVAAILQGGHVLVECLPLIPYQDDSAGRGELSGDAALTQGRSCRLPGYGFRSFRLAQGLEQANPQTVGIKTVAIVQNRGFVPRLVSL